MGNHEIPPEPSDPAPPARLWWLLAIGMAVVAFLSLQLPIVSPTPRPISYSEIKKLIRDGSVSEATLRATAIVAVLRSPAADSAERVRAITPQQPDPALLPLLEEKGVIVTAEEPRTPSILITFLPWILILAFYFWLTRRMTGGGIGGGLPGRMGDFLGGRTSKPSKSTHKITFADVAGQDEAKHAYPVSSGG